jgi:pectate lyase
MGGPLNIYVRGTITPANSNGLSFIEIKDKANISILGFGTSGELDGIGIKLKSSNNVVIRNLKIHNVESGTKNCIYLDGPVSNTWIDHCEFYSGIQAADKGRYNSLLEVSSNCEYLTVSWNFFHDSWQANSIGSADSDQYDRKLTFHHNYYLNCDAGTPTYRYGTGHLYNNYYADILTSGIDTRQAARLLIESNCFEHARDPIISLDDALPGYWNVKNNIFIDCQGNQPETSTGRFTPLYSYSLTPVNDVKTTVTQYAGVGIITP